MPARWRLDGLDVLLSEVNIYLALDAGAGLMTDYTQNIFLTKCFDSFFMFQLSPDATLH